MAQADHVIESRAKVVQTQCVVCSLGRHCQVHTVLQLPVLRELAEAVRKRCLAGAPSRNRTGTPARARDFKSRVSTDFTIGAVWLAFYSNASAVFHTRERRQKNRRKAFFNQ